MIGVDVQAHSTDDLIAFPQCDGEYVVVLLAVVRVRGNPALRLAIGIRVRNAQRVEGHLACIDQALDVWRIGEREIPQHQALGAQHRVILSRDQIANAIRDFLFSGNDAVALQRIQK